MMAFQYENDGVMIFKLIDDFVCHGYRMFVYMFVLVHKSYAKEITANVFTQNKHLKGKREFFIHLKFVQRW